MSVIERQQRPRWNLPPFVDATLPVEVWHDPVTERVGAPVGSAYTERFWLPVLGPTTTWLLRHLDARLEESPAGILLHVGEAARALGVATTSDNAGPLARALNRCVIFGLAQPVGSVVAVRRWVPPLPGKYAGQLPEGLWVAHGRWLNECGGAARGG